jgi:hypothetical protein
MSSSWMSSWGEMREAKVEGEVVTAGPNAGRNRKLSLSCILRALRFSRN